MNRETGMAMVEARYEAEKNKNIEARRSLVVLKNTLQSLKERVK